MSSINEVVISGRLTADPEHRFTQNNTAVCRFNLAVDRYNGEGRENTADFIPCTAWAGLADHVSKYYFRGKKAIVKGNIRTFSWQDQQGQTRYGWEVVVEKIDFADDKKADGHQQKNAPQGTPPPYQQPSTPPQNQQYQQNQQGRQQYQGGNGYRAPQNPPPPPQSTFQQESQPRYPWETNGQ